jgi:hypothetical protein
MNRLTTIDYATNPYQMTSVLLYNVWHYANFLLSSALKKQFGRQLLALTRLAVHFEGFIIGGLGLSTLNILGCKTRKLIRVDLTLNSAS